MVFRQLRLVPTADVHRASPKPAAVGPNAAITRSAYAPPTTTTGRGRYSEPPWELLPVDKRGWMNYVASALEEVCVNKTKLSREMHRIQRRPNRSRLRIGASLLIASFALFPVPAHAFVAAGDRVFPGTLILPDGRDLHPRRHPV